MKKLLLLMIGAIVALAANADVTIRFQNSNNWSQVNIWAWDGNNEGGDWLAANGYKNGDNNYSWPGPKMTLNTASGCYEITFTNAPASIIFSNDGNNQKEVIYEAGAIYNADGKIELQKVYLFNNLDSSWDPDEMSSVDGGLTYEITKEATITDGTLLIRIGDSEYFAQNQSQAVDYTGGEKTYTLQKDNRTDIAVKKTGKFKFVYTIASKQLKISEENGGTTEQEYTIYFYDKNNSNYSTVKAYIWNSDGSKYNAAYPGEAMTSTNKYVKEGDNYYPAWSYTFSAAWTPAKVIITDASSDTSDPQKITNGDATFVNDGFYTNGSSTGDTTKTLVDKPDASTVDFWLLGEFNKWGLKDDSYKFTTTDYVNYTLTLPAEISGDFKINSGSWASAGGIELTGTFSDFGNGFSVGSGSGNMNAGTVPQGTVFKLVYTGNGKGTLTIGESSVDPDPTDKPTALYFHVKYDIDRHGSGDDPWVWLYKKGTADNIKYESDNSHHKMVKVSEDHKYSLWMYELQDGDLDNYDACAFYFTGNNDNNKIYRSATYNDNSDDVADYEKDNYAWAKYIYATATNDNRDFAVQTYLTYDEFKALDQLDIDNGGRRNIYLVGDVNYSENGTDPTCSGTLLSDPTKAYQVAQDGGCFYLPLQKSYDNRWFKVSWINTAEHANRVGNNNSDRNWATFDLGLIGVDKDSKWIATDGDENIPEGTPVYYPNAAPNGELHFTENKSVPYMNYNQANWVLPNDDTWRWLVIDTHTEENSGFACHTATLVTFNPQPTVEAEASNLQTTVISAEEALAYRNERLYGAADNGSVLLTNVNYADGKAKINAVGSKELQNFSRVYTLTISGVETTVDMTDTDATGFTLAYMPVGSGEKAVSLRARYTDQNTQLSFHSRTSYSEMTLNGFELAAPTEPTFSNVGYVYDFDNSDKTTTSAYGVYAEGLKVSVSDNNYAVYADFEFDGGVSQKIVSQSHWLFKYGFNSWGQTWTPFEYEATTTDGYNAGTHDWSTKLLTNSAPVFIGNVTAKPLAGDEITCRVYAVYPFLYNPEPEVEWITTGSNAPARVTEATDGTTDGTTDGNLKIALARVPSTTAILTIGSVTSGIGNVAVDAEADTAAEYYTVSGIRVTGDPAPGIYIRRQGGKAEKVVIR